MKLGLVLFFVFAGGAHSWAMGSSFILKCKTENAQWGSTILVDAIGSSFLRLKKTTDKEYTTCGLKIEHMSDQRRGVVSLYRLMFSLGSCDPDLGKNSSEILKSLRLTVDLSHPEKPTATLQWLRRHQPDQCEVEKINLQDLVANAKKWEEGRWGRSTASEPKKFKLNDKTK